MPPLADRFGTALSGFVLLPCRRRLVWFEDPWARSLLFGLVAVGRLPSLRASPPLVYASSISSLSPARGCKWTKREKTLKTIFVLVEDSFHSTREKAVSKCLMPNVSLNKKNQRSLLHIKPDNDMHARNYIKKTRTLFSVSPCYPSMLSIHVTHPCYPFTCYVVQINVKKLHLIMFKYLSESYMLIVCFDSKSKWEAITFILIAREHLLCGIRDEDGDFLPLPSPWTHVYSLYIVYL